MKQNKMINCDGWQALLSKLSAHEKDEYRIRRLEEELSILRKNYERAKKSEKIGSTEQILLEEIKGYKVFIIHSYYYYPSLLLLPNYIVITITLLHSYYYYPITLLLLLPKFNHLSSQAGVTAFKLCSLAYEDLLPNC